MYIRIIESFIIYKYTNTILLKVLDIEFYIKPFTFTTILLRRRCFLLLFWSNHTEVYLHDLVSKRRGSYMSYGKLVIILLVWRGLYLNFSGQRRGLHTEGPLGRES